MSIASSSRTLLQTSVYRRVPSYIPAIRVRAAHPIILASPVLPETLQSRRGFASHSTGEKRGFKASYLFGGLASFGLLVTIYGLLEYYYSLTAWPEPVRTPLKSAIKAKNQGEWDRSEVYFRKAIAAALSLPPQALEPDPLEKLSGLYIALAALLESQGGLVPSYIALREALDLFGPNPWTPGGPTGDWNGGQPGSALDHRRVIGLAQKLGQLALEIGSSGSGKWSGAAAFPLPPNGERGKGPTGWEEAAEYYLERAVTAMLKLGLQPPASDSVTGDPQAQAGKDGVIAGRDIHLPSGGKGGAEDESQGRVDRRGLGMTMESLAEVYAKQGKYDLASQLLLQAVSLLLPPRSPGGEDDLAGAPSLRDQCQAAMLMTTISSHALHPPSPQSIRVSSSWSLKALQVADHGLGAADKGDPACRICGRAKSVGLYNLGMLAEMQGQTQEAADRFTQSLATAKEHGFNEGRREASDAIRRIQSRIGSGAGA